jgi:hypothetical protein
VTSLSFDQMFLFEKHVLSKCVCFDRNVEQHDGWVDLLLS